jgi:two-component system, OmpR family, sensor histidine kinase KdpD
LSSDLVARRRGSAPWRADLISLAGGFGALATVALALRLVQVTPNATIAALLFLLVVVAVATVARLRTAIVVSAAAMVGFNFFLLPPFHTLRIDDPQNWVTLFVFIVVATVASQLSAAARQREALKQRAGLTSALLGSLSHDLSTPVTAVRVAVENLQDRSLTEGERATQARIATEQLERLGRLLHDILDMARIDTAAVKAHRQWVTPADVVDAALSYAGTSLGERALQIDADATHGVDLDPRLTSTALAHLIENAVRYSPDSAPIEIRAWTDHGGMRAQVRDHGRGIAESDMAHVFDPFFRGATVPETAGTGLGLTITRGLVEAEGGRVWCANAPGGGAQFDLAIPAAVRPTGEERG